jgi:hypothetical protein
LWACIEYFGGFNPGLAAGLYEVAQHHGLRRIGPQLQLAVGKLHVVDFSVFKGRVIHLLRLFQQGFAQLATGFYHRVANGSGRPGATL